MLETKKDSYDVFLIDLFVWILFGLFQRKKEKKKKKERKGGGGIGRSEGIQTRRRSHEESEYIELPDIKYWLSTDFRIIDKLQSFSGVLVNTGNSTYTRKR